MGGVFAGGDVVSSVIDGLHPTVILPVRADRAGTAADLRVALVVAAQQKPAPVHHI